MRLHPVLLALAGFAVLTLSAPTRAEEGPTPATPPSSPAAAPAPTAEAAPQAGHEGSGEGGTSEELPAAAADPHLKVVDPARLGYAFDRPRVLAQQRIFGIARATAQLASLCEVEVENDDAREAARDAYAAWNERNAAPVHEAEAALARYYFGPNAHLAGGDDIAAALRLPAALKLDDAELGAACATLPQALEGPRYDLVANLERARNFTLSEAAETLPAVVDTCRPQLPDTARDALDERYARWQERNGETADDARAGLAAALAAELADDKARGGELADGAEGDPLVPWHNEIRRRARDFARQPAFCDGLADQVDGPRFDLTQLFADRPL